MTGIGWSQGQHRGTDLAAQYQALNTKLIESRVYHTRHDPWCRLYNDAPETVQHITAGHEMQADANLEYHNKVAGLIYSYICVEYDLEVP